MAAAANAEIRKSKQELLSTGLEGLQKKLKKGKGVTKVRRGMGAGCSRDMLPRCGHRMTSAGGLRITLLWWIVKCS